MTTAQARSIGLIQELHELGNVYRLSKDYRRAEQHYRLALSLYETSFPDCHIEAMMCLMWLMDVLLQQGRSKEAKELENNIPKLNARRRRVELSQRRLAPT